MISPIHKKGDKLDPANYRAISLLSIPGKVFSRILLNKMKAKVEEALGESQFGFREGRGTMDATFVVRQIMEKAKEHQVAFDTIWREAQWKMLSAIGISSNLDIAMVGVFEVQNFWNPQVANEMFEGRSSITRSFSTR